MPTSSRPARQWRPGPRPGLRSAVALLVAASALLVGACGLLASSTPKPPLALPTPSCGGVKILIEGALPCEKVVEIAIRTLNDMAPEHLARGVERIDVELAGCPTGEVPPQVDCGTNDFAQFVTVTFEPSPPGGPIEPSLTVVVAPVSGDLLGIVNPLVR